MIQSTKCETKPFWYATTLQPRPWSIKLPSLSYACILNLGRSCYGKSIPSWAKTVLSGLPIRDTRKMLQWPPKNPGQNVAISDDCLLNSDASCCVKYMTSYNYNCMLNQPIWDPRTFSCVCALTLMLWGASRQELHQFWCLSSVWTLVCYTVGRTWSPRV